MAKGASPVLHGDTLVVNWDHEGESFLAALDKRTGQERWHVARREVTSWSTPIVVEHDGRVQVIVSGTERVRGYDLADGRVIWECGGLSHNIVASPVSAEGIVYAASSYETRAMLAIRLEGAQGDITGTEQVIWQRDRATPYVPSPLLYEGTLYFLRHYQGILTRVRAVDGRGIAGSSASGSDPRCLRVAGRRGGSCLHHRSGRQHAGHQPRRNPADDGAESSGRSLCGLGRAGGERDVSAWTRVPVLLERGDRLSCCVNEEEFPKCCELPSDVIRRPA